MNVRSLRLLNVMLHEDTTIDLPERGVVVVTGPNGAGKSSLIEAVALAGWGKTLRGTPAWPRNDKASTARIDCEGDLHIARSRVGGKVGLEWVYGTPKPTKFETTGKAQEALERVVGPFDVWRRSSVFSSQDAAHFTLATDAERKRLIEAILGHEDRFDSAVEKCRADLKAANEKLGVVQRRVEQNGLKVQSERRRLEEAKAQLKLMAPLVPVEALVGGQSADEFKRTIAVIDRELSGARARLRDADRAGAEHEATARAVRELLHRLKGERCPTCEQPITDGLRENLRGQAEAAKAAGESAHRAAQVGLEEVEAALRDLDAKRSEVVAAYQERLSAEGAHRRALEEVARTARQKKNLEELLASATRTIVELEEEGDELLAALDDATAEVSTLTVVETVLGLRGVRAHLLGRSLHGIEAVCNVWLARLRERSLSVALKPYSELKKGGVNDSISLDVLGAGEGYGYKASSGGERRRVDVALVLALAEVAGAAHGREPGTLWFDEVFDCLDEEGTEAVAAALFELAKKRCVVVITHSKFLVERLPGAQRLRIVQGRVDAIG